MVLKHASRLLAIFATAFGGIRTSVGHFIQEPPRRSFFPFPAFLAAIPNCARYCSHVRQNVFRDSGLRLHPSGLRKTVCFLCVEIVPAFSAVWRPQLHLVREAGY